MLVKGDIMKKKFILLLLFISFFFSCNYAYSINVKSSDYEIVETQSLEEAKDIDESKVDSVFETDKVKILKVDNKYSVYNKNTDSLIVEPIIDEISAYNENEYKIKVGKSVGYLNLENETCFLTNYDDINLYGQYIKTKKQNKYGLIDKDAKVILKPIYEKVGIFYSDNKEYISGKYNGKYKLYQNTGKLIPEDELYVISNEGYYLLAQNLKPELKKYRYNNSTIYQKVEHGDDNLVYEIEEIKLPEKVKVAAIKKDIISEEVDNNTPIENSEPFIVNDKQYLLLKKDDKYGIKTLKGKEIVPVKYDEIIPIKLCEHYKQPVFLTIKNNIYSEYSATGKLLAEQVYDKVNIYKYGKLYTYTNEDGIWTLRCNGNIIGQLLLEKDGYKYSKIKFHLLGLHKINELFISMLENAK